MSRKVETIVFDPDHAVVASDRRIALMNEKIDQPPDVPSEPLKERLVPLAAIRRLVMVHEGIFPVRDQPKEQH